MRLLKLEDLSRETLTDLARMYSRNWQSLDGLWFGAVESACGLDMASKLDLANWQKQSVTEAKRIRKILNLDGGLEAILTALSFMSWQLASPPFEVEQETPDRIVFGWKQCAVQESRRRAGKTVFQCKPMKLTLLAGVAAVIEPRAVVRCLNAPPDKTTGDYWCRWELTLPTP